MDNGMGQALTIRQAAAALGITPMAVRKRLLRGKLAGDKDETGQWLVYLPADTPANANGTGPAADTGAGTLNRLIAQQQQEIAFLREELRSRGGELQRKDAIIAGFATQIQALSATTSEVRQAVEVVAREVLPEEPESDRESGRPSWWRRLLYGAA
jgi:hypothetical protein